MVGKRDGKESTRKVHGVRGRTQAKALREHWGTGMRHKSRKCNAEKRAVLGDMFVEKSDECGGFGWS